MVVIGGCQGAFADGEMRPHAHYNPQSCPLPLKDLQVKAPHVALSKSLELPKPEIVDLRTTANSPDEDAIEVIISEPILNDAALVVIASPLHSLADKAGCLQKFAATKFPDRHLDITAAHIPYLMEKYQEDAFRPLFRTVSRSRSLSTQMIHWIHNFMDRESLYGKEAIDLCSGWGRNKLYLLGLHFETVDVMDQDS